MYEQTPVRVRHLLFRVYEAFDWSFTFATSRRVTGMDGTAGRQFSTLRRRLQQLGIELVITHLPLARCVHARLDSCVTGSQAYPKP
jgi:hypothetical protein